MKKVKASSTNKVTRMPGKLCIGNQIDPVLQNPISLQLFSLGDNRSLSSPNESYIYYNTFGVTDINVLQNHKYVKLDEFLKYLIEDGWYNCKTHKTIKEDSTIDTYQLWLKEGGYMLSLYLDTKDIINPDNYPISISEKEALETNLAVINRLDIFYPAKNSEDSKNQDFLAALTKAIRDNYYEELKKNKISIISHDGREYYAKTFNLTGKVPPFIHMDEHYGEGFVDFHSSLVDRVVKESKGLVLFHGSPGTGKTQYIRMLLSELTAVNKSVLYVPPGFSAQLTEPSMVEFISEWVLDQDQDCILLIEDAEPLLEIRNGMDGRSTGISNLLNMTDGILNDMLGLMVIATFNTSISKIDGALLRAGRLIARKEFGGLSELQAYKLAKVLDMSLPDLEYPSTLAQFYSSHRNNEILTHSVSTEKTIGFGNLT